MSFVSYAQNFEDLMLWRALGHVEGGTYVDVGAQHPVVDSVSKAFYLHGWRGVHIEPVPHYADLLRQDRPGDTVLQVALGATEGVLALNVIPDTGLSTAIERYAQSHRAHGFAAQRIHVPMLTLKTALGMLAGREVHWLKVDVEGFEEQVLRGWDSTALRPWVLVVEATVPGSARTDYARWEPLVRGAGYRFVYFDGLNRFYIAHEHPELAVAFGAPPNVFDDVRLSGYASWALCADVAARHAVRLADAERAWRERLAGARADAAAQGHALRARHAALLKRCGELIVERDRARAQYDTANAARAALDGQVAALRQEQQDGLQRMAEMRAATHEWWSVADRVSRELDAMRASTSWRITAPLRRAKSVMRRLPDLPRQAAGWSARGVRATARPLVAWGMRRVLAHPGMRDAAFRIVNRHPALKYRLRGIAGRAGLFAAPPAIAAVVHSGAAAPDIGARRDLPPRIAGLVRQLKRHSARSG